MPSIWDFVTDFGDSAVTVPLGLLTLVFLIAQRRRRLALAWILTIVGCAAAIGALKLVFGACGSLIAGADIVSPSGHTAMSTAVYGALALMIGGQVSPRHRLAVGTLAAAAIVGIGLSRLALHDHTPAEIAVGFLVGAVALVAFGSMARPLDAPPLPLKWLLVAGAVLVAVMHGTRWMVEPAIHRLAWDFRLILPWCR